MGWRNARGRAVRAAASGRLGTGLTEAYKAGMEEANAAWKEVTGFDSPDEYEEAQASPEHPALALLRANAQFAGQWIQHDGELRHVRRYPNGRYGYWSADGEFVDVDLRPEVGS